MPKSNAGGGKSGGGKSGGGKSAGAGRPMTPSAAARIQSATAKANGGAVDAGSFAARAQSAAATKA